MRGYFRNYYGVKIIGSGLITVLLFFPVQQVWAWLYDKKITQSDWELYKTLEERRGTPRYDDPESIVKAFMDDIIEYPLHRSLRDYRMEYKTCYVPVSNIAYVDRSKKSISELDEEWEITGECETFFIANDPQYKYMGGLPEILISSYKIKPAVDKIYINTYDIFGTRRINNIESNQEIKGYIFSNLNLRASIHYVSIDATYRPNSFTPRNSPKKNRLNDSSMLQVICIESFGCKIMSYGAMYRMKGKLVFVQERW